MKKLTYLIVAAMLIVCSCSPEKKEETETVESSSSSSLLGEWRNLTLKVTMKAEVDSVLEVAEGQWEEVLKIQPIRTTFKEDGTYTSEYRSLEDQIMTTATGTWSVSGDELTMEERGVNTTYKFSIDGDIVTFSGQLDWDSDGEADDLYFGTQKRYTEGQ